MHTARLMSVVALLAACDRVATRPPDPRPTLGIVTAVGFAPGAEVSDEVVDDCEIQPQIIEELVDEAERDFSITLLPGHEGVMTRALVLRFARVQAAGGGVVSGAKSVTLEGRLLEGGAVVASFTAQRTTINGYAGGYYRGTCDLVENVLEELAEDITEWLRQPTLGALLGEL